MFPDTVTMIHRTKREPMMAVSAALNSTGPSVLLRWGGLGALGAVDGGAAGEQRLQAGAGVPGAPL